MEAQFLGYTGSVAAVGPDPRLSAVGISFPPVLVFGTALLGSPLLLQSLLGSLALLGMWQQLAQLPVGVGWRWLWGMLMVVQPSFGLMLLRSPSWIAAAGLLGINMALLLPLSQVGNATKDSVPLLQAEVDPGTGSPILSTPEMIVQGQRPLPVTLRLVLLGLGLAPLMLLRWESGWLLLWVALLVLLAFWRESWGFRGTAVLVTSFMSLTLILGWLYMNWLATGDPWAFTYQLGSGLRLPQLQAELIAVQGWNGLAEAGFWLLAVVPAYLIVGVGTLFSSGSGRWVWAMGWACPIVLLVASLGQGLFLPELSRFGMFWVLMPLLLGSYLRVGQAGLGRRLGITAALLLSLLTSGYVLTQRTGVAEEQDLWQRLQISSRQPSQLVQQWQTQRQEQRQVGQYLLQHLLPGQRVLADDALHFEAIFWAGDPRSFVTPHQYDFSIALQQPQERVDYLLLAGPQNPVRASDSVVQFWSGLAFGELLPGFVEVYGSPQVRLLARSQEVGL
ncbi:hypothetical protein JX360_09840 [Synechococcus bigranulatus str. 'Rupite']|uniref:Uncharacterized protein n=1 Tax=Thermostichus vulcanus str. 'Rupite' TaxID=2813851 RepID=A0ABT0CCZ7_THEVL|nr:hypothetical protein [Thermostichus vulcanus str. 'Rupite']